MRYYKLFLCLFLSTGLSAQISFNASTLSGYESNINKVPSTFFTNGELLEREDLHMNSAYQDAILRFKYLKKWNRSSLTAYITPEIRYYFSETDANQLILNTRLTFKSDLSKKARWETSVQYKIKDREGQDLDQNELSVPFGYKLFTAYSGFRVRMYKNNRSFFRLNAGNKKFDNSNSRSVQYNYYGIEAEIKNIKWRNHLLHSYGITLQYTNRDYDITNFSDNSSSDRTWQYFDAGVFYKLPLNKKWSVTPRISYQKRNDKTNDVFGYSQIRPELLFAHTSEKINARFTVNYTKRNFDNLDAENSDGDVVGNLAYDYWRIRSTFEYKLNNRLSVVSEAYLLDRASNNTDVNTTAFRSYITNYVGLGLKYQF